MIDQAGIGVNSVKSRLVDWILGGASLFIVFLINLRGRPIYHFFHPRCLFLNLKRCRTTTRVLKSVDDVFGFTQISHQDQELLTILIGELKFFREQRKPTVCIKKQALTAPNRKQQSTTSVALTKDHIIVLYTNADVLTQEKKRELGVHIAQEKPHIIAVTEVNPKARCFQQQDYQIPNYIMFDVNVGAQGRRGVVVFVHTSLEKSVSSIEIVSEFEETLLLSLKLRAGDCLLFGVFYRSPSSSESNNLALNTILSTLCVQESPKYSHLCVVGDFNFPGINWSAVLTCQEGSMEDKFIETMENCFLHQHILSPTRCRVNTTPHILDLVLSNEEEMVSEIKHLVFLGSSDHQVISFKYSCYADWSKSQHKFNYGKGDFVGARLYLDEHPIRVDGDVDSMWESFKQSVIEVCDRHIPLMRIGARK